ncbi:tRNA lysidine(34) synthetase TilS [Alkalihalophilus pseudofirmus]|uniref:tRNA lysidine(34) synthetase TilS n=1 Tax=Alkalihalophilus pseudofirmus TaxID=79885 RepID=UPI00259B7CB7|nr:tRNA lysidine(34) synthetase TilS [Alkalihalophilus pseudofirmus]WEG17051.1 tRNA lysidine(34) synthetase TilS [Alkalihalophilus pseudofirmus]
MNQDVHDFIIKHKLLNEVQTVFVAVSGGPDSMALLHYLIKRREMYGIEVEAVHVNHQLRGAESVDDEQYVRNFCTEHNIPLHTKKMDVQTFAAQNKMGTQKAASELRYHWFDEWLENRPHSCIATAHHGDDQTETILMTMVRGGNLLVPSGINVKRILQNGFVIRPFLGITKEEIEHYCKREGITPRIDSSNHSMKYTRNRYRQQIMPFIKSENPSVHIHMQRFQEWQRDDQSYLMELAEEAFKSIVVKKSEQSITISIEATERLRFPLQRRVIHLILRYLYGKNSPSSTSIHIEQIIRLLNRQEPSKELHLANGLFVYLSYDCCHFTLKPQIKEEQPLVPLTVPGKTDTAAGTFTSYYLETSDIPEDQKHMLHLDADKVVFPLSIRGVLPGDRISLRGMSGTKKVNRLYIDRKVDSAVRKVWPLLVDGSGELLWVPLLHRSKSAVITDQTKRVLVLVFVPCISI